MAITRFRQDNIDLRNRFQSAFAAGNPAIRVIWESQPEDYGGTPFPPIDGEYVRIVIRQNTSQQVSVGPVRRFRHFGTISVYVQTVANLGTKRNEEIADLVGRAMGAVTLSGIVLRDPVYRQLMAQDGLGFRGSVTIPYHSTFDE